MRMKSADRTSKATKSTLVLLANGDRMKQPEFHQRYAAYPDKHVVFELIGGTVYMASPLRYSHARFDNKLALIFGLYESATPGVEAAGNATVILGEDSEPQPDVSLRVTQSSGGHSRINKENYVEGAPELLAEVSHSSRAIDMNQKRDDNKKAGVVEYLVLCVEEQKLHWFDFSKANTIRPKADGISRSRVFPGLWIDAKALLAKNTSRLIEVVQMGIASRPHAAFVRRLERARRRS
jgi:Uma2 family endonuclease